MHWQIEKRLLTKTLIFIWNLFTIKKTQTLLPTIPIYTKANSLTQNTILYKHSHIFSGDYFLCRQQRQLKNRNYTKGWRRKGNRWSGRYENERDFLDVCVGPQPVELVVGKVVFGGRASCWPGLHAARFGRGGGGAGATSHRAAGWGVGRREGFLETAFALLPESVL